MANDDSMDDGAEVPLIDLDWMSREMIRELDKADGTATSTEVRIGVGVENMGSINHRLGERLEPWGLIDVIHREKINGEHQSRIFTLTRPGERLAEELKELEEGDRKEDPLPLDQRLKRLESALDSDYGMLSIEKQQEFQVTFEMMRTMRDFLLEEYGEDFKTYVDENFDG